MSGHLRLTYSRIAVAQLFGVSAFVQMKPRFIFKVTAVFAHDLRPEDPKLSSSYLLGEGGYSRRHWAALLGKFRGFFAQAAFCRTEESDSHNASTFYYHRAAWGRRLAPG